ncbi:methylmalonyl-CoA mutase subunit beta [Aquimarina sp. W85]|uniref:methylmalonyl-CoA mutase subunit beta n=1 Tax=Aquimarina rhodophyticola TaxID=3342246 RepID=UPI00366CBB6B
MIKSFFEGFDEVSAKQWKQKIQVDLKGADYNEALIYKSLEGIDIKPFYNQEDLEGITPKNQNPTHWNVTHKIEVKDSNQGNDAALESISKGAEAIFFIIHSETIDIKILLKNLPETTTIYITPLFLSTSFCKSVNLFAKQTKQHIYLLTDNIGHLASSGNWFESLQKDQETLESIINHGAYLKSILAVDMSLYQNAGATMVQQLAYGLAHANEYLNHFEHIKTEKPEAKEIVFTIAVGGNYFFEIAKLKALRILWSSLRKAYDIIPSCHIVAFPASRNKTVFDYNVNMLRTTMESMSAILGGANAIYNMPYDAIYHNENEFGNRIAINQLLILKHESNFDMVSNPASGSYYIETLTNQLANEALEIFKSIEKGGGFLAQLKSGQIQKKIKESAIKEQTLFDQEVIKLTGANSYRNANEIIPDFDKSPFLEKKSRKTLIEPIIRKRLSEKIEKKQLNL